MFRAVTRQLRRNIRKVPCVTVSSKRGMLLAGVIVKTEQLPLAVTSRIARLPAHYRGIYTTSALLANIKQFECPGLPESISDGGMKYLKEVGDRVEVDETVCEIETQKTALPVRSDVAGVLKEYLVEDGDNVTPGTALFAIAVGEGASEVPVAKAVATEPEAKAPEPTPVAPPIAPPTAPSPVSTAEPVSTVFPPAKPLASSPPPKAVPSLSKPASTTHSETTQSSRTESRVRMTRMRQTIAARLKDAQNTYAMLTTFNEVDMSAVFELREMYKEAFMKKHGVKLGFMSPFIVAAAAALKDTPAVNAVIDGNEIVYRNYVDISVAVATPRGLVVPVIRNADKMTLADAEKCLADLGDRAKTGAITLEDMDGGTFTISNGGVFGSMFGTPIINPPQSAILGMHNVVERAVVVRDPGAPKSAPPRIEARPCMYLALTYDHRIIDGRDAVTFLRKIKAVVEDPRRLLLDISL